MPDIFDLDLKCCGCGGRGNVRNIVMHNLRAPVPGTGWGCFQCHLSLEWSSVSNLRRLRGCRRASDRSCRLLWQGGRQQARPDRHPE
jgi:hypothetical protein